MGMSELEARVKALEDQWQALARVFVAPPQPATQSKLPAQMANENTTKESLVCACGKPKKSGYSQCFVCWEKGRVPK
jgi:hypothetical protein